MEEEWSKEEGFQEEQWNPESSFYLVASEVNYNILLMATSLASDRLAGNQGGGANMPSLYFNAKFIREAWSTCRLGREGVTGQPTHFPSLRQGALPSSFKVTQSLKGTTNGIENA